MSDTTAKRPCISSSGRPSLAGVCKQSIECVEGGAEVLKDETAIVKLKLVGAGEGGGACLTTGMSDGSMVPSESTATATVQIH